MNDILIKNGRVWNGEKFLDDATDVLIKDGKIADIGKIEEEARYVFDARGAIISPGLVDVHTHNKGVSCDEFGISAEAVCYPAGVTCAVDACATNLYGKIHLDNMNFKSFVFVETYIRQGSVNFERTEKLIETYGDKVLGLKVFFDTQSPEIRDARPLEKICNYAKEKGLKVLVHSTGSPVPMNDIFDILKKGDICTHILQGGANNIAEDDFRCMEKANKKGIVLDNGMAGGVHTDFCIAKKAIETGFYPHTISSDITKLSAFIRGGNYSLNLAMTLCRQLGMSEVEVLKCVTSSAWKVIDKSDCLGYIKKGAPADVCVLNYVEKPFDICDTQGNNLKGEFGYHTYLTVSGGQVMYRTNI